MVARCQLTFAHSKAQERKGDGAVSQRNTNLQKKSDKEYYFALTRQLKRRWKKGCNEVPHWPQSRV
jgi:hypothetical protein